MTAFRPSEAGPAIQTQTSAVKSVNRRRPKAKRKSASRMASALTVAGIKLFKTGPTKSMETADRKAEAKKAEKKRKDKLEDDDDGDSDTITITASSIEDLIKKIGDYTQMSMSDNVLTDSEQKVGQHIDFKG